LGPPPAGRSRRANLHRPHSTESRSSTYHKLPSAFGTHADEDVSGARWCSVTLLRLTAGASMTPDWTAERQPTPGLPLYFAGSRTPPSRQRCRIHPPGPLRSRSPTDVVDLGRLRLRLRRSRAVRNRSAPHSRDRRRRRLWALTFGGLSPSSQLATLHHPHYQGPQAVAGSQ
jgi:hypothetical protein